MIHDWWFGIDIGHRQLFWMPVFVLGRIGKFLQYPGATAVILDIIGAERLRNFGVRAAVRRDASLDRLRMMRTFATGRRRRWSRLTNQPIENGSRLAEELDRVSRSAGYGWFLFGTLAPLVLIGLIAASLIVLFGQPTMFLSLAGACMIPGAVISSVFAAWTMLGIPGWRGGGYVPSWAPSCRTCPDFRGEDACELFADCCLSVCAGGFIAGPAGFLSDDLGADARSRVQLSKTITFRQTLHVRRRLNCIHGKVHGCFDGTATSYG